MRSPLALRSGRFYTLAIGLALAGALLVPLIAAGSALTIGLVLLASSFGKGLFDGCIYAAMHDVVPREARASAVGLMTMWGFIGAGLTPLFVAKAAKVFGMGAGITSLCVLYFVAVGVLLVDAQLHASGRHRDARARGVSAHHERVTLRSGSERTARAWLRPAGNAAARRRSGAHSHALFWRQRRARSCRSIAARIPSCTGAWTRPRACSCRRTRRAGPIRCATSAMRKSARSSKSAAPCATCIPASACSARGDIARIMSRPATTPATGCCPPAADPRIGIFSHIGAVALNGVHDAAIRVGDLVVVFGLGVAGTDRCASSARGGRHGDRRRSGTRATRDGARSGRRPRAGSGRRIRRRSDQGRNRWTRRGCLHRSVGRARGARGSDSHRRVREPRRGDGILSGRSARTDAGRGVPSQPHRARLLADLRSCAGCESSLEQTAAVAKRRSPAARRALEPAAADHAQRALRARPLPCSHASMPANPGCCRPY